MTTSNTEATNTYSETAKRLNCTFRVGKWGVKLFGVRPDGSHHLIQVISLDGWIFAPHEIVQAIADDHDFSIKYGGKK